MGAYGGSRTASIPPYGWAILCDINDDGTVDLTDLAWYACLYPQTGNELSPDFNRDQSIDANDLNLLADDWLKTTVRR